MVVTERSSHVVATRYGWSRARTLLLQNGTVSTGWFIFHLIKVKTQVSYCSYMYHSLSCCPSSSNNSSFPLHQNHCSDFNFTSASTISYVVSDLIGKNTSNEKKTFWRDKWVHCIMSKTFLSGFVLTRCMEIENNKTAVAFYIHLLTVAISIFFFKFNCCQLTMLSSDNSCSV